LFYLLGLFAYIGGPALAHLAENPLFFGSITIGLLWLTALANIQNIGIGKWVNNVGGLGTLAAAVVLIALGAVSVWKFGISLPIAAFNPNNLDLNAFSVFGVICFGLVGLELGCVMGDEIDNPRRSVPRGVLYGGTLSALQYLGATLALLLAVRQSDMKVLQGVLQGVDKMTVRLGTSWVLMPLALLVAVSVIGATSAWLSGSARILFVSGIDQYLPKVFGKLHSKHDTPYFALCAIATLSSGLIVMSFAGSSTVKEAYILLIDLAVALQMISYSYVYASLFRVAFGPRGAASPHKWRIRFAAISGMLTTAFGLIFAFVPSHQVDSVWRFEVKMILSCLGLLGLAGCLFVYYSRQRSTIPVVTAQTAAGTL
jgi:amino acid transporter